MGECPICDANIAGSGDRRSPQADVGVVLGGELPLKWPATAGRFSLAGARPRAFHGASTNRSGRNTVKTRPLQLALCAAVSAILPSPAPAVEGEPETRQSRFTTRAHESKGLRGDEHQHFMSECLKGRVAEEGARHEAGGHPTPAEA